MLHIGAWLVFAWPAIGTLKLARLMAWQRLAASRMTLVP
jgi:hypothetical protein